MEIKSIQSTEIESIVDIHCKSFDSFFLTQLGRKFLSTYYESVRKSKEGIVLACYEKEKMLGFCVATSLSTKFHIKIVKDNLWSFSKQGLRIAFTNPMALLRLSKNISKKNYEFADTGEYAELLSIATLPEKQGLGVGKKLLMQLEKNLKLNGCSKLSLTTDYYDNEKTIQFYIGLGYAVYYEFTVYPNRKMYRLIKHL